MSEEQSGSQIYQRLLTYIKPYWKVFLVALFFNAAFGYIDTTIIYTFKPLLDDGVTNLDMSILSIAPFVVIMMLFVRGIVSFISAYCMSFVGNNVIRDIRNQLFKRYLLMPADFFDSHKSGELISKIIYNTEQLNKSTTDTITTIIRNMAMIIFAFAQMFRESWQLTLLYLVVAPVIAVLVSVTTKRFRIISRGIQNAMGDITQRTQESIESYQAVKIYGGQDLERAKFAEVNKKNYRQTMKMDITKALSIPIIQLIAGLGIALVLYFAVIKIVEGSLSGGGFTIMLMYMLYVLKPLKSLSSVNSVLQRGISAAESVFEVLDHESEIDEGTRTVKRAEGNIQLKNVSFQYSTAQSVTLTDINLNIESGKTIALVGRSGSGKSTLASILLRFYDVSSGDILLDGHNINDYKLDDYRHQIAFVSQHVTLFNDSIANNIAYGMAEVSEQAIIEAAKKAHAWEFIKELAHGLQTEIGERGMLLSGGQRQRLAIARAILKDAPILILDEATSALDTESEKYIQQAMNQVMDNRTTIVVAHRLSTIENADTIVVMDKGQIAESGTHQDLLDKKGIYAGLYQMQFKD